MKVDLQNKSIKQTCVLKRSAGLVLENRIQIKLKAFQKRPNFEHPKPTRFTDNCETKQIGMQKSCHVEIYDLCLPFRKKKRFLSSEKQPEMYTIHLSLQRSYEPLKPSNTRGSGAHAEELFESAFVRSESVMYSYRSELFGLLLRARECAACGRGRAPTGDATLA
ncbi:hypothetical protein EVAR_30972_1 [Eumeta japonica]|uniref:Uncharacterized protein n=1 Tax=Eumeta variegata TaxID=151549 RepID=A0A4C1W7S0_EUMVA|nr:hypothetical protein EVAR_30972_1 [Eumeta japonica]